VARPDAAIRPGSRGGQGLRVSAAEGAEEGLAGVVIFVPEPSTALLVRGGLLGLGMLGRRGV
jgi:hypothetical protein